MNDLGKALMLIGFVVMVVGALIWMGFGIGWLGRLPGDIQFTKGTFRLHLPIVTCLLISVVLTVVLWLFRK
jgi:hypothetical protein